MALQLAPRVIALGRLPVASPVRDLAMQLYHRGVRVQVWSDVPAGYAVDQVLNTADRHIGAQIDNIVGRFIGGQLGHEPTGLQLSLMPGNAYGNRVLIIHRLPQPQ